MQLQPIDYLTKKERDMLEQMNREMKQLQDKKEVDEDIFKMNIGNIGKKWVDAMVNILDEMLRYIKKIESSKAGWVSHLQNILRILIKDDRGIYVGISLILLSMGLYFIVISS